jgi:hypothetical protein
MVKGVEGNGLGLIMRYSPRICLKAPRKNEESPQAEDLEYLS